MRSADSDQIPAAASPTASQPGDRRWRRRRVVRGVLVALCIVGAYRAYAWWVGPERKIKQAAAAWARRDWGAMMRYGDRAEIEALSLTPDKYRVLMEGCTAWTGGTYRLVPVKFLRYSPWQRRTNRALRLLVCDASGKPIRDAFGYDALAHVMAYKTDGGWRVGLSSAGMRALFCAIPEAQPRWKQYRRICARAGIPARELQPEDGAWTDGPKVAQGH